MTGTAKKYPYKNVSGLCFPDANTGDSIYYAIDLTCLTSVEFENIDTVEWILPNEITLVDSYLTSDKSEAHVRLSTPIAGQYRLYVKINSTDLGKVSENRIKVMLRVI